MKEVMAIIRMNNTNSTKKALEQLGFPSITCRRVLGRGKSPADYELVSGKPVQNQNNPLNGELATRSVRIGQIHSFMPKRLFTMIVHDEDVSKVVDTIIEVNKKGSPGDGKIFVIEIDEAVSIRTMERGDAAI